MKFSAAAAATLALNKYRANAFIAPPRSPLLCVATRLSVTPDDPYTSVVEAISSAADAANAAAAKSAGLAASLGAPDFDMSKLNIDMSKFDVDMSKLNVDMDAINVANINADAIREKLSSLEMNLDEIDVDGALSHVMTPEAIAAGHAKLALLESNLDKFTDQAVMTQSIHDALDASIAAAQHAASSATALQANLADFDGAFARSMELYHASLAQAYPLSPEAAEVAQAKLALLVHNLSGGALNLNDAFVTNFLADLDRKLDHLAANTDSTTVWYATVAIAMVLSAKELGKQGYNKELRHRMERDDLNTDGLEESAGIAAVKFSSESEAKVAMLKKRMAAEKERLALASASALEDPAVAMTAAANVAAPAAPLQPAVAMMAMTGNKEEASLEDPAVAMEALASEEITRARVTAAAAKPATMKTQDAVAVEFSAQSKVKVTVLKKRVAAAKKKLAAATIVPASPLARMLADELGLDLRSLGKGSGKNGRILIDDVRQFHARMDEAKNSMSNGAYFVTARA